MSSDTAIFIGMVVPENAENVIAQLREELAATRKRRMAAQKAVAASPVLEVALERASRDRSSAATDETDSLREEIGSLRDDIVHEIRQVDRVRNLFAMADAAFPDLPQRIRLCAELNSETRWREEVLADERTRELRLIFPRNEEVF